MKKEIRKLIQSIVCILMGLQIVLGILWIGGNLGEIPRFEESMDLLTMSETLVMDEYTGILYPVCIRVLMLVGNGLGIPWGAFLYILQIMVAGLAYSYFLKEAVYHKAETDWYLRGKLFFFSGYVITIPTILQCHMAVLPYSLASSVFIILLADTIKLWHREYVMNTKLVLRLGVLWVISAQILPEYAWFSAIAVGISVMRYMWLTKKVSVKLLIMILVSVLCIHTLNATLQVEGSGGKIQKSMGAAMLLRCVWPNFLNFQFFWSPEVTELWEYSDLAEFSTFPEKVIYRFGPEMEEMYGRERANEIYWEMAEIAVNMDTRNIVINIASDGLAYICPTLTMYLNLQGVGVSYSGWNYGRLKEYTPRLAKYYTDFALDAWIYILALGIVLGMLSFRKKEAVGTMSKHLPKRAWIGCYFGILSIVINIWYVLNSGSMQDYKKLIVNSILWAFLVVKLLSNKKEEG